MNTYNLHLVLDKETTKQARKKCIDLDISLLQYTMNLLKADLK